MTITFSTASQHPRDRLSYWVDEVTKLFFRHTFCAASRGAFHGELQAAQLGPVKIGRYSIDAGEARRSALDQARDDIDDIFVVMRLSGEAVVDQVGRQALHGPGSLVLLDTRLPGGTRYKDRTQSVIATVPRVAFEARLGNLSSLIARPIAGANPVAGLAAGFMSLLAARAGDVDPASGARLADQALDLIALACSTELAVSRVVLSSPRACALLKLKSVIEARLCDPDLKPAAAANEAGVSVRYANDLLSQEGTSTERYILQRRLERCRCALEDSRQAGRTISEIAFAWGFSDLSHFTRRFRAAYGKKPSEWRREAETCGAPSLDGPPRLSDRPGR